MLRRSLPPTADRAAAAPGRTESVTGLLFIAPVLAVVSLFILWPVAGSAVNSLFRDVSYLPRKFIGLDNYLSLVNNAKFVWALEFTLAFTLVAVALETVLGAIFALTLNTALPGRGVLRMVMLIPWAIPTIVSAKVWKLIFDYHHGLLNAVVLGIGLSEARINWLGTPALAFWSLVAAEVWKTTPFMALLLLAGLQGVPAELYRQARVDGAGPLRRFFAITAPLLRPVLMVALIFRTVDSLRIFDLVYVLTGGGPGDSTTTLSMLGYQYYSGDVFGAGAAVSTITFMVVFACAMLYVKAGSFGRSES